MRWLKNNKGNLGSLFGGKKDNPYSSVKLPDFQVDSNYTQAIKTQSDLGEKILKGNVPDYYKPIGDFNSDAFKQLISNVSGQINQGAQENAAISGVGRSGTAQAAAAGALSNVIPQLQYQDYNRAISGRGALLDTGIGIENNVAQEGQNQEGMLNNFNLKNFQNQMDLTGATDKWNQQYAQQQGQAIGTIGSIVGGIGGFMIGGPMGASLGSNLGGMIGGGGSNSGGGISSLLSAIQGTTGGGVNISQLGAFGGGTSAMNFSPAERAASATSFSGGF